MSVGFRIFTQRPLPDPELVRAYGAFATAPVADAMHRMCAMTPDVRLLSDPVGTMSGVALTVKARPGDSLMIHKALNMAEEGDVLIVSGGESGRSLMGELMFRYAASKKLAGIVVDGPIRDADCLRGFPLPVYASGFTPGGPYREGPGEINVPVVCCGQSVEPGTSSSGTATASSSSRREMRPVCTTRRGNPMSGIWRRPRMPAGGFLIVDG